jgi:hypothetical protein
MFVSLEQSSFFDAFRDEFYALSPNKVRAVKTMSFNNDVARTEFDRLMTEYCTSK